MKHILPFLGLVATMAGPLAAQEPAADELRALRLSPEASSAMLLDGLLSERFWLEAHAISDFRQQEPDEGAPATERTEIRIAFDDENLYVGVIAFDSEPDRIVGRILQRDKLMKLEDFFRRPEFAGDDAIAILFDPFHDSRNGVVFATNANGAEFEALLTDEGTEFNIDWRAVWEVAAERIPDGWSAEFVIPLRTLRYPKNGTGEPWGFNVYRTIRRKNEMVLWQSWSRDNEGFHRVSRAGHIVGLEGLPSPGINVEVKPYMLGGTRQELQDDGTLPRDNEVDIGLDLKSELRPGLVLDVTLNTDFAQVEVDDEKVNLTRFSLFFPEKRDFFLENAGIFEVGIPGNPMEPPPYQLFFSRRIGIGGEDDDEVIPLLGGARLTGRVGGQTVGFLNLVTDEMGDEPRTNYAVARMKRDVGQNNFVGWMVTDRRDASSSNTVAAADGSWWVKPTLNLKGFFTRSFTSGEGGDDNTYFLGMDYSTDLFGAGLTHLTVGPEAVADMGFITREDIRRTDAYVRFAPRPGRWGVRSFTFFLATNYTSTVDGSLQDQSVSTYFGPQFESGDGIGILLAKGQTVLDEDFDLADSIRVDPGKFDADMALIFLSSAPHRAVVAGGSLRAQRFYGGTLKGGDARLLISPTPQISMAVTHSLNRANMPNGEFTANVTSFRLGYAFSTKLTTNALVQYNSLDNSFSSNVRLNFIHRPGSDLFIVLTEERGEEDRLWDVTDRGLALKLTYLMRF